jgi:hypothetical protein
MRRKTRFVAAVAVVELTERNQRVEMCIVDRDVSVVVAAFSSTLRCVGLFS